ncbi:MAG: hypothetical protein OEV40_14815 [Acidimicrobiia bacterium]|nr:hypothetical protein [Acidimicrobiia bacterium]
MFGSLQNRQRRRGLATAFLALLAAFPLVGWMTGRMWPVLVLLAPYAALSVLLAAATYGIMDRPLRGLDERELEQRRSLFREPYVTGTSLGIVGGLVMAAGLGAEDGLMMGTLLAVVGLLYGLPSLVFTWTLPNDDSVIGE